MVSIYVFHVTVEPCVHIKRGLWSLFLCFVVGGVRDGPTNSWLMGGGDYVNVILVRLLIMLLSVGLGPAWQVQPGDVILSVSCRQSTLSRWGLRISSVRC